MNPKFQTNERLIMSELAALLKALWYLLCMLLGGIR